MTSVVIADDDILLREGMASLLGRCGFEVVGQAGDGAALLDLVRSKRPDLAIVDIRMPPTQSTEGLETARLVRDEFPDVGIMVLSAHIEVHHALELLSSGDRIGYLLKSRITDVMDFTESLHRVARGGSVVDPGLVHELFLANRNSEDPIDTLTPREREVLGLMAEGLSNSGIARRIFVAEGTVEKHVHSILSKLQLPESAEGHRRVLAVVSYLEWR